MKKLIKTKDDFEGLSETMAEEAKGDIELG